MQNEGITQFLNFLKTRKNQNDYVMHLRLSGFMLCPLEFVKDHLPETKHPERWQYFVRATRFSKTEPHKDRFDFSLIIGVKYAFKRIPYVRVFAEGELHSIVKMPWPQAAKSNANFKKPKRLVEFPEGMTYEERRIWRDEYAKHYLTPGKYKPTEFYLKWKDHVLWTDQEGYNKRLKTTKLSYKQ